MPKPKSKKPTTRKKVVVLRENDHLFLARTVNAPLTAPSDPEEFAKILETLRGMFNAPNAMYELLTVARYEKKFPIVTRLIAESFEFKEAERFFELMSKS